MRQDQITNGMVNAISTVSVCTLEIRSIKKRGKLAVKLLTVLRLNVQSQPCGVNVNITHTPAIAKFCLKTINYNDT